MFDYEIYGRFTTGSRFMKQEDYDYNGKETELIQAEEESKFKAEKAAYHHNSESCGLEMGGTGFEHPPLEQSKTPISGEGGTESGTLNSKDPDLALVVKFWPGLPEHIKAAIKTLIKSS